MKILIISNHPVAHRVDFFNALVHSYGQDNIHFCFVSDKTSHKRNICVLENEDFLASSDIIDPCSKLKTSFILIKKCFSFKPDIVVIGGFPFYTCFVCFMSLFFRFKLVNWWGGTREVRKNISWVQVLYRKFLALFFSGGMFYSKLAQEDLLDMRSGLKHLLVLGNNTRDSQKVFNVASTLKEEYHGTALRFVTVGFQLPHKNTLRLLEAADLLKQNGTDDFTISVIGDGSELPKLKDYAAEHHLPVTFYGHLAQNEIFKVLANSDIFIHPSYMDRWPQTYNEATSVGLPVLISNLAGVADDYVEEYGKHILFDPMNVNEIAEKMKMVIDDRKFLKELAQKALASALASDGIAGVKRLRVFFSSLLKS